MCIPLIFQKRGLPHAHILIILRNEDKIHDTDRLDRLIKAQLPDKKNSREKKLFDMVCRHMIHGPCGGLNPTSTCMEKNKCTKEFPKEFTEATQINKNGYPSYHRPDNGIICQKMHNGKVLIVILSFFSYSRLTH